MGWRDSVEFKTLTGKTLKKIDAKSDSIEFETEDGGHFRMYHDQNCCESVDVEEIIGDVNDLIGHPILLAEEVSSTDPDEETIATRKAAYEKEKAASKDPNDFYYFGPTEQNNWKEESETWTFYKLSTIKGSVTIRWYGSSNGYYSESVDFIDLNHKED